MAEDWLSRQRSAIEAALAALLPECDGPEARLLQAMRYAVLGAGKRLRPLLCLAAAEAVAGEVPERAWPPALALELLHAYSLIHDDLPALDDDDWRRGQPSCHKQFGVATAILAGDALQTMAFRQFADPRLAARGAEYLAVLAAAASAMVAGQSADLEANAQSPVGAVEFIHRHKTAALIRAALVMGGMAGGATAEEQEALAAAGEELGFAFQIVDDILDASGEDRARDKATYPAALGLEPARAAAERLAAQALGRLAVFGARGEPLRQVAGAMVHRRR